MNYLKLLGSHLDNKYNIKEAMDAENVRQDVISSLTTSIANASTQNTLGILPFKKMLAEDKASLSFIVNRSDHLASTVITVDNLNVSPRELQAKYAPVAGQVQSYLDRFPEVFPTKLNGETITYNNFSATLNFGED